jgi:hypothetical protein
MSLSCSTTLATFCRPLAFKKSPPPLFYTTDLECAVPRYVVSRTTCLVPRYPGVSGRFAVLPSNVRMLREAGCFY